MPPYGATGRFLKVSLPSDRIPGCGGGAMSMKHTIETVRTEVSRLQRSADVLGNVVEDVRDRLVRYFGYGRKMPEQALRGLVADLHATITAELRPIRERLDVRRPTRVRPKSEAYELFYLVMMPEDLPGEETPRYFRLTSIRILATRKRVMLEFMPTALGVREHAAVRFARRGADVSEAIRILATSLAEWAALPGLVDDALEKAGFERMGITGDRGLMLGYLDPRAPIPAGQRFVFGNEHWSQEDVPVLPTSSASFSINTFIGPVEMKPNQVGAMLVMDRWREQCGDDFRLACEEVFWPERELSGPRDVSIDEDLVQEMRRLVVEKRMLKAMGNAKVAGMRFDLYEDERADDTPGPDECEDEEMQAAGEPAMSLR